jgi:hypothetical protein
MRDHYLPEKRKEGIWAKRENQATPPDSAMYRSSGVSPVFLRPLFYAGRFFPFSRSVADGTGAEAEGRRECIFRPLRVKLRPVA